MLFRLERDKDCVVMNRISNGQYEWNWSSSILGARNSTHLNNMLAEISQIEFSEDMDKCIWSLAHDGAFSVGSLRRVINDHTLPSLDIDDMRQVEPRHEDILGYLLHASKIVAEKEAVVDGFRVVINSGATTYYYHKNGHRFDVFLGFDPFFFVIVCLNSLQSKMTGGLYENTRRQFSSNEDFTKKISHSVFVTNFPDYVNSRDLWNKCSVYGTVIDVFIPNKKSKAGKRFAFVRFIKVFNLDRLVKNLCTIWIGSYHLFANQVRYDRPQKPLNPNTNVPQKYGSKKDADHRNGSTGSHQKKGGVTSYVSVVNGVTPLVQPGNSLSSAPALVLDEECVVERDFSNCAMGRVKSFDSITKLQSLLVDEGFVNVTLSYLGGLWVMFECDKPDTKRNLVNHVGINSWFQVIQEVNPDFVSDERVVWLDIEGVPLYAWSRKSFDKIGNKWGEVLNIEDSYETSFGLNKELNKEVSPNDNAKSNEHSQVVHEDVSFNSVADLMSNLNDLKRLEGYDYLPKAKVRWAIEGDENVQNQVADLERHVSHDEIRLAVWDCGVNKSPGPDGFTSVDEDVFKRHSFTGILLLSHLIMRIDDAFFMGEWSDNNLRGSRQLRWKTSSVSWGYCGAWDDSSKAWDEVILKAQRRLSKWKAKTLSIGGRLTLLKSVLGASPLYNMSIFKVPKGVLKVMESIRSNFFKGASMLEKKISWIAWDKVLASKKKGDDSLWFRVIQAVHGDKIDSHSVRKVSIWSSILKEVQVLKSSGFDFLSYCSKRIGWSID
ncbi:RNA-directed DNA polymerase, eukaryota, nucleotide-binding alpha-beta plait domain protein [Tanacetum coccineum]